MRWWARTCSLQRIWIIVICLLWEHLGVFITSFKILCCLSRHKYIRFIHRSLARSGALLTNKSRENRVYEAERTVRHYSRCTYRCYSASGAPPAFLCLTIPWAIYTQSKSHRSDSSSISLETIYWWQKCYLLSSRTHSIHTWVHDYDILMTWLNSRSSPTIPNNQSK